MKINIRAIVASSGCFLLGLSLGLKIEQPQPMFAEGEWPVEDCNEVQRCEPPEYVGYRLENCWDSADRCYDEFATWAEECACPVPPDFTTMRMNDGLRHDIEIDGYHAWGHAVNFASTPDSDPFSN